MSANATLTPALAKLVLRVETDMRRRLEEDDTATLERWRLEHREATTRGRTAMGWTEWSKDRFTQAAMAWVLTTVFVRFVEDNALVRKVWISGPPSRRQEALDGRDAFFRAHPLDTDREWLLSAFEHLGGLRSMAGLVDANSALHLAAPSGQMATVILEFWWQRDASGGLLHDLTDPEMSTRFLGDLYQDLSKDARDRYALLQTPVFVEEFILDRAMEPALAERPLEGFKMIDPACGSGHFLLGAFARLLDRWHRHGPGLDLQERVQSALDGVHGVDLNPFAVAIARFRLTVAALQACGLRSLEDAPAFRLHLATGDSLLHGGQLSFFGDKDERGEPAFTYSTESLVALRSILDAGTYDCVVGNPPYITVKDRALNEAYRERYDACSGKYALTVPFMQRLFEMAKPGGWVGQITSNSFMKREFGGKLIEKFLAGRDLRLVADTSGAYIPGHGTPTVIIVGRNQPPTNGTVRAALGVRGEPGRPTDPAHGIVWRSLADHIDQPGWDDGWVTIADLPRGVLATHPWSLSGGGASALLGRIDAGGNVRLGERADAIGVVAVLGEEDAYELPSWSTEPAVPLVIGEAVRDYQLSGSPRFWPYDSDLEVSERARASCHMWPSRSVVAGYLMFGKVRAQRGMEWFEYGMLATAKLRTPLSIAFAFVATHNHFVLDRGGKVFNRTAPVIKLPPDSREDDHLALLGVLNSSTACFWLKQVAFDKGGSGDWERRYEFNAANVEDYPIPALLPLERGRTLDVLAQQLSALAPDAIAARAHPTRASLDDARVEHDRVRADMIAHQEELDWKVYRLYGLIDDDLTHPGDDLPGLALGQRAFEIALARRVAAGEEETAWFTRHGSTPIADIPDHWPAAYRELVHRRLDLIAADPSIRLLERPEHKRRWASETWEKREARALRRWILDHLEDRGYWFDAQGRPAPQSVAKLADQVARDPELVGVINLWEGRPDVSVTASLTKLTEDECVPYLAALRYKPSGLDKRAEWEATWDLQRREDAGVAVGAIPVPPKYTTADFRRTSYWQLRGKLDVPKERFIAFPQAGRDTDPTPLLGWAGWTHAEQSLALLGLIQSRIEEGWNADRLRPLVAGVAELQPWVEQWHGEIDQRYGTSLAAFCREQLAQRASGVERSVEELRGYRGEDNKVTEEVMAT